MPFTLLASACPVPTVFSGSYVPTSGPLTSRSYTDGDTTTVRPYLNENAARGDLLGRFGGGGNALVHGLDLTAGSGLAVNVAAGQAIIDGVVTVTATSVTGLTANVRNYIWLSRDGTLSFTTSLTAPGTTYLFIGSALCGASTVSSVDQSGVMYLKGGTLFRRTADIVTPTDTPPAQLQFFNRGASKLWWWDGSAYWLTSGGTATLTTAEQVVAITTNYTLTAAEVGNACVRITDGGGLAAGWMVTWPSASVTAGQAWEVRNDSGKAGRITLQGGSDEIHLNAGRQVHVAYTDGELKVTGRQFPSIHVGTDYTVTSPKTWSNIEEVEGMHFEYTPSGGNVIVNYPNAGALDMRGMRQTILNDHTTSYMQFRTNGAATDPEKQTYLLPGEIQGFVIKNDGIMVRDHTRPYMAKVGIVYGSDANKTVAHPDFLAIALDITSSTTLTATRDLVLPTVSDKLWVIKNATTGGQMLTAKTSGGSGVTVPWGRTVVVFCDGTDILPWAPQVERAITEYPAGKIFEQTASTTVTNTATETPLTGTGLGTRTIPANFLLLGRSVRIRASGYFSTSGTPTTLNVRIKLGSTTILATGDQTPAASITDRYWNIDAIITCRTAGASGTVIAQSAFEHLAGATGNLQAWGMVNTATVTVDTTAAAAADITCDWGAGVDASHSMTLSNLTVELLG